MFPGQVFADPAASFPSQRFPAPRVRQQRINVPGVTGDVSGLRKQRRAVNDGPCLGQIERH
jgi:hypothetical protein